MPNTQIAVLPDHTPPETSMPDSREAIAGGIVHDLNNVFSSLTIAAHLLRQDLGAERRRSLVASLERAAARGQELLDEFTRHGERQATEEIELDLEILLEAVARTVRARPGGRASLTTSYEDDLPRIQGDPSELFALFHSTLSEAAAAAEEGTTTSVRCRLARGPRTALADRPTVEVQIGDPTGGAVEVVRLPAVDRRTQPATEAPDCELWGAGGVTRVLLEQPSH